MELRKRKYKKNEVQTFVNETAREYEAKLAEQKARIADLLRENCDLRAELDGYLSQDKQISSALKKAEEYSDGIKKKSDMQYELAVEKISAFLDKWSVYFNHIKEKYPMYPVVQDAVKIQKQVKSIIGETDAKTVILTADSLMSDLKKERAFDPKSKIADYIAATEGGFNMDEVLNPGALRLEDLCKELGLITEKE